MDSLGLTNWTVMVENFGRGILLYVRGDNSSSLITNYKLQNHIECLFIEIKIRKKKWLFCCSYNPNKNNISDHLHCLSNGLDTYISQHDNILLLRDLNVETSNPVLNDFCNVYNLFSLAKEPCFKISYDPSCIDLFITNCQRSFDCYHRNRYIRFPYNGHYGFKSFLYIYIYIIQYKSYKNFDNQVFQRELNSKLLNIDLNNAYLSEFSKIFLSIPDKHTPKEQKFI